ncbi:MAG: helix-turn-helix transcriptional regulator [Candidatus Lernaella stagnicola]|nr:helix-turn-helix transcriptional regulator [Candidatus Lernaella stagnicola]
MKNKEFSERVRQLVKEYANGVYSRFGRMVGVAQPTIKRYLEGDALPNFQVIKKICNTCGITPNWLVYGWEPKYREAESYMHKGFRIVIGEDVPSAYDAEFKAIPLLTPAAWANPRAKGPVVNEETCTEYMLAPNWPDADYVAIRMPDAGMRGEIEKGDLILMNLKVPKRLTPRTLLVIKHGDVVTIRRPLGTVLYSNDPSRFPPVEIKNVKVLGLVTEARRRVETERKIKKL